MEKKEESNKDDDDGDKVCKTVFGSDTYSDIIVPLPSSESDSTSLSPFTSSKLDPSESRSIKEEGSNPDPNNADTINCSIPSVDDTKIGKTQNPKNLNGFLMSDSDSSLDSLPPFTSFRKIGHLDETKDSGQKEADSAAGTLPPPVPNLDLISGLSQSEKESSCSTDNASILPKSSSYKVFDADTDTTIPLPSTDNSSYTPFTSTKSEAEQRCLESPPFLGSALAMKNPQQDLNGNPWSGIEQTATGIYISGIKGRREDSTSSDDSLPPFNYFRDEGKEMVPLGRIPTPPVSQEKYLNALSDLGETISNLKIDEGSIRKKNAHINKETQTESSEIPKSNAGTQTGLQSDNKATQAIFQTSQTGTQTEKLILEEIVRIKEKERKPTVTVSTITEDDVSTQPEASSSAPYLLSPADPLSYFSLPQTEFEARILHFKSHSLIFVCTESTFAKLRALQVNI